MRLKEIAKAKEEPATDHVAFRVGRSVRTELDQLRAHYGEKSVAVWLRRTFGELIKKEHSSLVKKPA